jgi:PadR family transcriptional regulator, regulatory protein PadR
MPEDRGGEQPAAVLPRNYMRSCVLLLLREEPAHGYDLLQRLRPLGFGRDDPGRLYRALRALEDEGLVRSAWEASDSGPDRRIYELTRAGLKQLHEEAKALDELRETLGAFAGRYEEFVALRSERRRAPTGSR